LGKPNLILFGPAELSAAHHAGAWQAADNVGGTTRGRQRELPGVHAKAVEPGHAYASLAGRLAPARGAGPEPAPIPRPDRRCRRPRRARPAPDRSRISRSR